MTINPTILSDTFDPSAPLEMSDAIGYGLQTTLLGMGVVFAVLIILWAVLALFKVIFYKKPDANEETASASENKAPAPAAAPQPAVIPASDEADDAELVAVITAAIAAMMDAPQTSFRVVSFRRTARK